MKQFWFICFTNECGFEWLGSFDKWVGTTKHE